MNIIVCVKEIADPEAPADSFRLDPENKVLATSPKVLRVINPFDEQAVEAALRIKDAVGARVTTLALGKGLDRVVVKKPLFMGADELILLEDDAFAGGDSWSTVLALSSAIKKIGSYDLILCGRQAADWNAGQVGSGIAEMLKLPSVTVARKIEIVDKKARVERVTADGYEVVEVSLPAVITVSNEIGQARYPAIQNIRTANKIQPLVWKPSDIGLDASDVGAKGRKLTILKLFQPVSEGICAIMEGETQQEMAENLALTLRKEKIL
ncbi:MAG TPA: electron transfer flavoprotein subunit beta/FixA family protein [Syntrophorhabdaceae bacterium]|nr:electron transfer flavoprotein subunit beta/FixA family protein [Syntrophorhabdaceae bacterium]